MIPSKSQYLFLNLKRTITLALWVMQIFSFHNFAERTPINYNAASKTFIADSFKISFHAGSYYRINKLTLNTSRDTVVSGYKYGVLFTDDAFKGDLQVSKGYFPNFVRLQWNPYKISNVTQFKIFRKKLSQPDSDYQLVQTLENSASSWSDDFTEPGTMYMYKVLADGLWNEELYGLNVLNGIGFRITSAVVTGRVTYEGGNVVKGVKVNVVPNSLTQSESEYSYLFKNKVSARIDFKKAPIFQNGFSFQTWLMPTIKTGILNYPIFRFGDISVFYNIEKSNSSKYLNGLVLYANNQLFASDIDKNILNGFSQFTLTYNNVNGNFKIYLNGSLVLDENISRTFSMYASQLDLGSSPDYVPQQWIREEWVYQPYLDPHTSMFNPDSVPDYDPKNSGSIYYNESLDPTSANFDWSLVSNYNPRNETGYYYLDVLNPQNSNFDPTRIHNYNPMDTSSPYYLKALDPSQPEFNSNLIKEYNPKDQSQVYYLKERDPSNYDFNPELVPNYNPFDTVSIYYMIGRNPSIYGFYAPFIKNYNPKDSTSIYYYEKRNPEKRSFDPAIVMNYNPKDKSSVYYYVYLDPESPLFDYLHLNNYDPTDNKGYYYTHLRNPNSWSFRWDWIEDFNPFFGGMFYAEFRDPASNNFSEYSVGNYNPRDTTSLFYCPQRNPASPSFDYSIIKDYNPKDSRGFYYYAALDPNSSSFDYRKIAGYNPSDTLGVYYLLLLDPIKNPDVNPMNVNFNYKLINFYDPQDINSPYYYDYRDPSDGNVFNWHLFDNQFGRYVPTDKTAPYYYAPLDPSSESFDSTLIANYDPTDIGSPYYLQDKDPSFNSKTSPASRYFEYWLVSGYNPFDLSSSYYYISRDPSRREFNTLLVNGYNPTDTSSVYYYTKRDPSLYEFDHTIVKKCVATDSTTIGYYFDLYTYDPKDESSVYYYAQRDPENALFDTTIIAGYNPSDTNSPYYLQSKDPNVFGKTDPSSRLFEYWLIPNYDPKDTSSTYYYAPRDPSKREFNSDLLIGFNPFNVNYPYYYYPPRNPSLTVFDSNLVVNYDPTNQSSLYYYSKRDPNSPDYDSVFVNGNAMMPSPKIEKVQTVSYSTTEVITSPTVPAKVSTIPYDINNYKKKVSTIEIYYAKGNSSSHFNGYMDEVKFWNKALSPQEVYETFDAIQNPNNPNLIAYWRMDEGGGNYFYDISRNNSSFNENHGYFTSDSLNLYGSFEKIIPTKDQLGNKALTDSTGNYVVPGINYTSGGSYYKVVPSLGIHRFDPSNKLLYVSQEANVFNNIDFKDISSFTVKGRVMYKNTNYPVKGVILKVDGVIAVDKNRQPVMTNDQGEYSVNVPIGLHHISVEKTGHVFESAFWPMLDSFGNTVDFDFQEEVNNVNFEDATRVKMIGKIVGGPVEASKPSGSKVNASKNNIGSIQVTLTTEKGVDLWDSIPTISFRTDSATGFYQVNLLPEKFIVRNNTSIQNSHYTFNRPEDMTVLDLSNKFNLSYVVDSIFKDTVNSDNKLVHTYLRNDTVMSYNHLRDWIWRESPNLSIGNMLNTQFIGDSIIHFNSDQPGLDLIDSGGNYVVGKPVFSQAKTYDLRVMATETYKNYDLDPLQPAIDLVPINDGVLVVNNQLSMENSTSTLRLDQEGEAVLSFIGGNPLDANPFTKNLNVKLKINGNFIQGAEISEDCYLFGLKPFGGVNFVTGPDQIDFVLHDPPGSNSYSYLNQGYTVTKERTKVDQKGLSSNMDFALMLGFDITSTAGTPFFMIRNKIETELTSKFSTSHSFNWSKSNTEQSTTTYNFNYATSDQSNYVGAMGDVFVGHGTNIFYGASNRVKLMKISENEYNNLSGGSPKFNIDNQYYVIAANKSMYVGQSQTTDFIYSLNHIENYLIPNLKSLRNSKFDGIKLVSKLEPTNPYYGYNNDDPVFRNASIDTTGTQISGPSYTYTYSSTNTRDSIRYYNSIINHWKENLANNERNKLRSLPYPGQNKQLSNISFDAGSSFEASMTTTGTQSSVSTFDYHVDATVAFSAGFKVNSTGFEMNLSETFNTNSSESQTEINENSKTIGFKLADSNQGDYFSLDVKSDPVYGTPVFMTKGGQSSCPFEGETKTKYYNVDSIISVATMQIEKPEIQVQNPVVSNIPENAKGQFSVLLSNTSETNSDVWFDVFVDPASNPHGAIVKMDGKALTDNISILVPAGKSVAKTVTLEKGRTDINQYENIGLILHSRCQFDGTSNIANIADTAKLSAYFTPVCTTVDILEPLDQWIANVDNQCVLPIKIGNYDLNLSTFKDFKLQYKPTEQSSWITLGVFVNDRTSVRNGSDTILLNNRSTMTYNWDMSSLQNRKYDLRVTAQCTDGSIYNSAIKSGIFDNIRPVVFGNPEPSDGILNFEDDIVFNFSEDIQSGLISPANIRLTGIENNTDLRTFDYITHNTSLHFDGSGQKVSIDQDISLKYSPFTIEFWAKRDRSGEECILTHGNPLLGGIFIGFDNENHFIMRLNGQILSSDSIYNDTITYSHYAVSFENTTSGDFLMKLITAFGDNSEVKTKRVSQNYYESGKLSVGYNSYNRIGFQGNIHDLRLWNNSSTEADVVSRRYTILNGYEKGLIGCWEMKEGFGSVLYDKSFARNGLIDADWRLSNKGSSLLFSGGYAWFNSSLMELSSENNFTLEFWFKSYAPNTTECILSNGKGDGTDISQDKWAVMANPDGTLSVQNDGTVYHLDNRILDGKWHHFAMSIQRKGSMIVYLDGVSKLNRASTGVSGWGSPKTVLGARYIRTLIGESFDMNFHGSLDDIRIWDGVKNQAEILSNFNHTLRGSELGLKAYFPFEDIHISDPSVPSSSLLNLTEDSMIVAGNCQKSGDVAFQTDAAPVQLAKPVVGIPFQFTAKGSQLLITPEIEGSKIENTTLNVSISGIYDKQGNRLKSPANWSAYVKRNQLVWENKFIQLTASPDNIPTFDLKIMNQGGETQNWQLNNLPLWLSVDYSSGTLEPLGTRTLHFTINPSVSIGQYQGDIYLSGNMDFNEKCAINLTVREKDPNWSVDESLFESSMSLIGQVYIAGNLSVDVNDIVAAFVNGECRGVSKVQYITKTGLYLLNLTVFGGESETEPVSIHVWDSSKGNLYTNVNTYTTNQSRFDLVFRANQILGTPALPIQIKTTDSIGVQIPVKTGWNWISFNLNSSQLNSSDKLLQNIPSKTGDLIKSGSGLFDQFVSPYGWDGNLGKSGYKITEMYKFKSSVKDSIDLSGVPGMTANYPVKIKNGWNWIGYTPQFKMDLKSAFSYHTPAQGDLVKSQSQFAMYDNDMGWIGSLLYMRPFAGYMYHSNRNDSTSFIYPQANVLSRVKGLMKTNLENSKEDLMRNESNMSILAELYVGNSKFNDANLVLYTYSGDEVLGMTQGVVVGDRVLYPILIEDYNTSGAPVENVQFKIKNNRTANELNSTENIKYVNDKILGNIQSPYQIHFNELNSGIEVFPNPFNTKLSIRNIPEGVTELTLTDLQGRKIKEWKNISTNSIEWDISNGDIKFTDGIYMLNMTGLNSYKPILLVRDRN